MAAEQAVPDENTLSELRAAAAAAEANPDASIM